MSKYSENYTKVNEGYLKILNCIDSCEDPEQMTAVENMTNLWVNLIDYYCDQVQTFDKRGRKLAESLAQAGVQMFNDIKERFQEKMVDFEPEEYTGMYKPVRIKNLREYADTE